MKKRGLSDVVAVTLIILLAIAAVVIVWAFVSNMLKDTGEQIKADCLTASIKPISCNITSNETIVESGSGDAILSKVRIVYYNAAGESGVVTDATGCDSIAPLQTKKCITPTLPALTGGIKNVGVASVFVDANANEKACPVSTERATCFT